MLAEQVKEGNCSILEQVLKQDEHLQSKRMPVPRYQKVGDSTTQVLFVASTWVKE